MLFNSHIFLFLFLPVTWLLFRILSQFKFTKTAIGTLAVASLVFYSYWNPPFVFLILYSMAFNFMTGWLITNQKRKSKFLLAFGAAMNLGLIAYFKYAGFLVLNINYIFGTLIEVPEIFLPLGISFFTFQQIAYLVDCHEGKCEEHNFLNYALFVTFFPQLIAGPIVHHGEMMVQFKRRETFVFSKTQVSMGLAFLAMGLFKKVILADTLSPWVQTVFDRMENPQLFMSWLGSLSYTLQIYFDFSGYSEMALGLGHLFNIELPLNFNAPYKATSIIDFWRRWHITLSRFLKDYLYIPLGGNRKGQPRRYINLMTTMFLGGLWHGAAWTFVMWGVLHGIFICINNMWRSISQKLGVNIPAVLGWFITFISVHFAWIFFRATTFDKAFVIVKGLVGLNGIETMKDSVLYVKDNDYIPSLPINDRVLIVVVMLIIAFAFPTGWKTIREKLAKWPIVSGVIAATMFFIAIMGLSRISEFLYFQF